MADLAATILDALDWRRQIAPVSTGDPSFGLEAAYRTADALMQARISRGERVAGWKIGFTNRGIWDEYGVHAPIWGPMYAGTIHAPAPSGRLSPVDADSLIEPRIEPEIAFRIASPPLPGMTEAELLGCIDAVCHGFEIVQSVYPGWRFTAADTIACGALHGAFVHGPFAAIDPANREEWLAALGSFSVELLRDGAVIDRGVGTAVLDGPLAALRHFVDGLASRPLSRGIEAGDLVTTGTVTRAFPVSDGDTWSTSLDGLPLPGMELRVERRFDGTLREWIGRASQARFRFENPGACSSEAEYQDAMSANVEAETAVARLLMRDPERLRQARAEIARQAALRSSAWKRRPGS